MVEGKTGCFTRIVLKPQVSISSGDPELARTLHHQAHSLCYIANSLNFPVLCEPTIVQSPQ